MQTIRLCLALALAGAALGAGAQTQSKSEPSAKQIDAAFAKLDTNKDGKLSRADASKLGIAKATFDEANPDNDETLNKKEMTAALSIQFKRANPDGDGTLDWTEAQKAGIKSRETFEAANPDKDGTLDMAEYFAALLLQTK